MPAYEAYGPTSIRLYASPSRKSQRREITGRYGAHPWMGYRRRRTLGDPVAGRRRACVFPFRTGLGIPHMGPRETDSPGTPKNCKFGSPWRIPHPSAGNYIIISAGPFSELPALPVAACFRPNRCYGAPGIIDVHWAAAGPPYLVQCRLLIIDQIFLAGPAASVPRLIK